MEPIEKTEPYLALVTFDHKKWWVVGEWENANAAYAGAFKHLEAKRLYEQAKVVVAGTRSHLAKSICAPFVDTPLAWYTGGGGTSNPNPNPTH